MLISRPPIIVNYGNPTIAPKSYPAKPTDFFKNYPWLSEGKHSNDEKPIISESWQVSKTGKPRRFQRPWANPTIGTFHISAFRFKSVVCFQTGKARYHLN